MSVKMKFGSKDIPFVYKGDKLVYPNPIKDGLLLWYDFKGMRNTDTNKEVAKDLSGNGNDGTLTNFNFTEESGYRDNSLVFDGVDDSLTIPELELDETAMTVMYDGKIYSYEDDKVMFVGEDGEIIGSGKNLLPSFYDSAWHKRQSDFVISPYHLRSDKGVNHAIIATIVLDVKPNTDYTIFVNTDLGRTRITGDSNTIMGYQSGDFSRVFNTGDNESVEVELGVFSGNVGEEINFSNVMLCQGRLTQRSFTPAPEDFQTTSLSPLSLSNLQLYNRSLLNNELLHNAESKGLKKLKPGVVVQDGLVLHYDFSHENNTSEYKDKAFDYSGNGNHGVLQNFGYTEGSGYDEGLTFDGVDDAIQSIDLWEDTGKVTVEAVIKKMPNGNNGAVIGATSRNFELLIFRDATVVAYYSDGDNANYRQHQFTLYELTEKINYLAVVFHKDLDKVELYHNGTLKTQRTDSENRDLTGFEPNDTIKLGHRNSTNRLQGEIYSTRIYKKALTPEEIQHNYQIEKEKFNITEGDD